MRRKSVWLAYISSCCPEVYKSTGLNRKIIISLPYEKKPRLRYSGLVWWLHNISDSGSFFLVALPFHCFTSLIVQDGLTLWFHPSQQKRKGEVKCMPLSFSRQVFHIDYSHSSGQNLEFTCLLGDKLGNAVFILNFHVSNKVMGFKKIITRDKRKRTIVDLFKSPSWFWYTWYYLFPSLSGYWCIKNSE